MPKLKERAAAVPCLLTCVAGLALVPHSALIGQSRLTCNVYWPESPSGSVTQQIAAYRRFLDACPRDGRARVAHARIRALESPAGTMSRGDPQRTARQRARDAAAQRDAAEPVAPILALNGVTSRQWASEPASILIARLLQASDFSQYLALARRGDARAQWLVGAAYYGGIGVPRDRATAATWIQRAADQGHARALNSRAIIYADAQDYVSAVQSYRLAADAGVTLAQTGLGSSYLAGRGVARDYVQAMLWYRRAAELGDAFGQAGVARLYRNGWGVPRDYAQARQWYRLSADQGNPAGQVGLGRLYADGLGVRQDYAQALIWYRRAADQGDADGQVQLGAMYEDGRGVTRNYAEAMRWYRRAADQGSGDGQDSLGFLYHNGLGVQRNPEEAMRWYRRAADQGHSDAQFRVGLLFEEQANHREAVSWYGRAAAQHLASAQNQLGLAYWHGRGVSQNDVTAAAWFHASAEQGLAEGELNLGVAYFTGRGVTQNHVMAEHWLRRASNRNLAAAQYTLGLVLYDGGPGLRRNRSEARRLMNTAAAQGHEVARRWLSQH